MDPYERLKQTLTTVGLMEYLPTFEENEFNDEMMDTIMSDLKLKKDYFPELVPKLAHRMKIEIEFKKVTTLQVEGIVIIKEEKPCCSTTTTPSQSSSVSRKRKSSSASELFIPKNEPLESQQQPITSTSVPNACPKPEPLESSTVLDTKNSTEMVSPNETQSLNLESNSSEHKDEIGITIKHEAMDYGREREEIECIDVPDSTSSDIDPEEQVLLEQTEALNLSSGSVTLEQEQEQIQSVEEQVGVEVGVGMDNVLPLYDSRKNPPSKWNWTKDQSLHSTSPCYIHFPNDETTNENTYRIGHFRLIVLSSNVQNPIPLPNVLLPGLSAFILHANDEPKPSVILLKVKRAQPLVKTKIKNGRKHFVSENFKNFYFQVNILDINQDFLAYGGLGSKKTFDLRFESQNGNEIKIAVNFLESAIVGHHKLEDIQPCPTSQLLPRVFDFLFGIEGNMRSEVGDNDIEQLDNLSSFYRQIKLYHKKNEKNLGTQVVQHPLLIPTLRKYQSDAVRWMIVREGQGPKVYQNKSLAHTPREEDAIDKLMKNIYHPIQLKKITGASGSVKSAFYNHLIGFVTNVKPSKPKVPTGGILGDETGLGKTLEVLALILTHQYREQCIPPEKKMKLDKAGKNEPIPIKTTLIVSPWSISHQWMEEIQRHVLSACASAPTSQPFKVLEYKGASVDGFIPPSRLGTYDVVITTYNVLAKELNFVDMPHLCGHSDSDVESKETSSLIHVKWWRICLDEAQMVQGITSKMSVMATMLKATHRWCVTGTPINKGLNDLFGLISFLKVRPICVKPFWDLMIGRAFVDSAQLNAMIHGTIGRFLWRNEKIDVQHELGLPPQEQVIHWLEFTVPEKYAYAQVYEDCKKDFEDKLKKLLMNKSEDIKNLPILSLNRTILKNVLRPLIRLRKECCDPDYRAELRNIHKGILSFKETVDHHIKSNKDSFAEAHHYALAHLNDAGDFHKLKKEWAEARDLYKKVVQLGVEAGPVQGLASLQVLHGMWNLVEILDKMGEAHGENSQRYQSYINIGTLIGEYKTRHRNQVVEAQSKMTNLSLTVEKCVTDVQILTFCGKYWWEEILSSLNESTVDQFWSGTRDGVSALRDKGRISELFRNRSVPALMDYIQRNLGELMTSRGRSLDIISKFCTKSAQEFVQESKLCHLGIKQKQERSKKGQSQGQGPSTPTPTPTPSTSTNPNPTQKVQIQCSMCKSLVHEIDRYEKVLLNDRFQSTILESKVGTTLRMKRQLDLEEQIYEPDHVLLEAEHLRSQQQRRRNSIVAQILEGILRFATKISTTPKHILDQGKIQLELFTAMRQEFWEIVRVRQMIFNNVAALYELEVYKNVVSKKSSTLSNPNFIKNKMNMHLKWKMEAEKYLTRFKSWTLKKEENSVDNAQPFSSCPNCKSTKISQLCFLPCVHSFCSTKCLKKIYPKTTSHTTQNLTCPLCHDTFKFKDISYVNVNNIASTSTSTRTPQEFKIIRGEYSSKVDGIVRTLLDLQESHPGEKIIIFSEWEDVLKCISLALKQNQIGYSMLCNDKTFEKELKRFKEVEGIQVLLMTIASGSKGLNIVEASHVFLVEPTLHQANELQAIARVHRIGQTRPTFVHRFLIRGSVEDKLFQMFERQTPQSKQILVKDLEKIIDPVHIY